MKFINLYLFLLVIFALLDPDPDPGTQLNPDPIHIRIHNSAGNDIETWQQHLKKNREKAP